MITVEDTRLEGVKIITPQVFGDSRGFFMETFNAREAAEAGLPVDYAQDNHSRSAKGVLRGLHYQYPNWQAKLIRVVAGVVFDVAVDLRRSSPTYGQWLGVHLSADDHRQLFIPEGFAHGFAVLSDSADFLYKCTALYEPSQDRCLIWNDPDIGIEWPLTDPLISAKDQNGQRFRDLEF